MIFALSLNLLLGYAGQVSVASAAFGAVGGYTVGYLTLTEGWNFLPAMLVGVGLAGIVGLLVSLPAMKLSPEYLILLTLAVSSVILGTFTTFPELGGTYGLINLPKVDALRLDADPLAATGCCRSSSPWPSCGSCAGGIGESPYGRVLKGIREDERAVQVARQERLPVQGRGVRHHLGHGRLRRCLPERLPAAGHARACSGSRSR